MTRPRRRFFDPFYWPAAFIALGVHSLAVFAFFLLRNSGWVSDDSSLQWDLWQRIDAPTAYVLALFEGAIGRMFHGPEDRPPEVVYAIQYGVFGGAQYFLIVGWGSGMIRRNAKKTESLPQASAAPSSPDRDNPYSAPHAEPSEQP